MRPALAFELADVVRRHGGSYARENAGHLGRVERRVLAAIAACRTAALGGHVERCDDCGLTRIAYNSCIMGKICNVESTGVDIDSTPFRSDWTPHYDLSLSMAISLSGGRKEPFLRCGGTMASMASSLSVGSPRI